VFESVCSRAPNTQPEHITVSVLFERLLITDLYTGSESI